MRHGFYSILITGLLSLAAAGRPAASPLSSHLEALHALDACMAHVFDANETVFEDAPLNLDSVCPDLGAQLNKPFFARLQPPLQRETTFRQLHDAQRSLASFTPAYSSRPKTLNHAGLTALLNDIYEPVVKPDSSSDLIDRFMTWIEEKLRGFFAENDWLTRNFDFTPEPDSGMFKGLVNTLIVILIVFILYIVINELRAANIWAMLKRRQRRAMHSETNIQVTEAQTIHHLGDIRKLPLDQQAPALLRFTIQTLVARDVLPGRYSLTNREFLALVHATLPGVAGDFAALVNSGELVVYGKQDLSEEHTAALFDNVKHIEQVRSAHTS